jgi:hypothetical protein
VLQSREKDIFSDIQTQTLLKFSFCACSYGETDELTRIIETCNQRICWIKYASANQFLDLDEN